MDQISKTRPGQGEKTFSPSRAPGRSLLPLSPKRTQVRLKSLLYLVWLTPDPLRTHGRPSVQECRLRVESRGGHGSSFDVQCCRCRGAIANASRKVIATPTRYLQESCFLETKEAPTAARSLADADVIQEMDVKNLRRRRDALGDLAQSPPGCENIR